MNSSIVKKTQDSLGRIIGKKPPLTEKLLNRPPFRFLHDVFSSVTRQTGFMKGLYTDKETSAETINSKDEKIAYLQKAIDIVVYVTGEKLSVRPSKIVSGLEAENTNEFLQALAAACNAQPDTESAVKAVLGGEKRSGKDSRSDRERSADKRKHREKSDKSEKIEDKAEEKEEKRDRGDRDRKRDRESSRDGRRESSRNRERGESSKGERGERQKDRESSRNRVEEKEREKSHDKSARDKEGRKDKDDKKERSSRRHKEEEKSVPLTNGDAENDKKEERSAEAGDEEPTTNRMPRPSSAKGSRRRHREGRSAPNDDDDDDAQKEEEAPALQPEPTQQKRLLRPASARPAPPKVKRADGVQDTLHDRIDSGTRRVENVIVDQANHSEDEDENFTVEENNIPADPITIEQEPVNMSTTEDGEHGGLVKKILESKKEFDSTQSQHTKTKIEKSSVNDATRQKEREMVKKEVDKLRASIQTLTRSANPLGKVMDYVQEDLHSMQKERDTWKQENRKLQGDIERELKVTDSSIEPLKSILSQLEQAVSDQLDLIAAAKHQIIDNDEKTFKMLSSISQG